MKDREITVGQLRQNPTEMIRRVRAGERYVLTHRDVAVADIVPHSIGAWRPADEVAAELRTLGADPLWAAEVATDRSQVRMTDPWGRP